MQVNICGNICERHCGKAFFAKNNQIKKFVCILMMSKILNDFLFLEVATHLFWNIFLTLDSSYHVQTKSVSMQQTEPQNRQAFPLFSYLREMFVTNFGWSVIKVLTSSLFINSKYMVFKQRRVLQHYMNLAEIELVMVLMCFSVYQ